jgi:type IV pilus assembly protein PilB
MNLTPLFKRNKLGRLGERLVSNGVIGDDELREALEHQRLAGGFLGEILTQMGFVTPSEIGPFLEEVTGFPFIDIAEIEIDRAVSSLIPESVAAGRRALPFREDEGRIWIAMADPLNMATTDELRAIIGRPIRPCLALYTDLADATRRAFDVRHKITGIIDTLPTVDEEDRTDGLAAEAEEAPIVRLVHNIVAGAIAAGASDIHVEPHEHNVQVRYRIDGMLYDQMTIPLSHLPAVSSRIKIMANLDIAERRRPQDGRFSARDEAGNEFDIRLSLLPTVYGEKACMRLLEKGNSIASLDRLGFLTTQLEMFKRFINRPHGLILVTGPTGSGKSTTLYAALQQINERTRNINTVEDPVEYRLPGINQVQVNNKVGLTFATGLRTLVRQDPDVILVGEIRDAETAEIAVQAALTGHLVLSTLHTNDAPGALVRLQHMGVEPFLVSSSVVGVVGQRLLRSVCHHCSQPYTPPQDLAQAIGVPVNDGLVPQMARSVGCKRCGMRGMRGRTAAYEIMPMTDNLRDMVLKGASGAELSHQAHNEGMMSMRQAAIEKALHLSVTPEEVMRVFAQEELG